MSVRMWAARIYGNQNCECLNVTLGRLDNSSRMINRKQILFLFYEIKHKAVLLDFITVM